jgi:hypothetical protein
MGTSWVRARLVRAIMFVAVSFTSVFSVHAQQDELNTHPAKPSELLAAIDHADKLVVYNFNFGAEESKREILYSSLKRKDISQLKESFIIEPPTEWFRCACLPMLEIELSRRGKKIGVISVFDELTIEFSGWSGDARISDPEKLFRWFDARGIAGPHRAAKAEAARERADAVAAERWLAGMPHDLRPLWQDILQNPLWWQLTTEAVKASAQTLEPVLAKEYPDVNQRIRALFSWFGSGAGPWSGFYAWEDVPSHMLLEYSGVQLVNSLQEGPLTNAEAEGAVRFFVGYTHGALFRPPEDRTLIAQLPDELKKTLLAHLEKISDQEKLELARKAFEIVQN